MSKNQQQFNHNIKKAQRQRIAITETEAQKYADWIFSECTDPIDEISFLVNTIQESNNDHVIQQVFQDMRKYNKL